MSFLLRTSKWARQYCRLMKSRNDNDIPIKVNAELQKQKAEIFEKIASDRKTDSRVDAVFAWTHRNHMMTVSTVVFVGGIVGSVIYALMTKAEAHFQAICGLDKDMVRMDHRMDHRMVQMDHRLSELIEGQKQMQLQMQKK